MSHILVEIAYVCIATALTTRTLVIVKNCVSKTIGIEKFKEEAKREIEQASIELDDNMRSIGIHASDSKIFIDKLNKFVKENRMAVHVIRYFLCLLPILNIISAKQDIETLLNVR